MSIARQNVPQAAQPPARERPNQVVVRDAQPHVAEPAVAVVLELALVALEPARPHALGPAPAALELAPQHAQAAAATTALAHALAAVTRGALEVAAEAVARAVRLPAQVHARQHAQVDAPRGVREHVKEPLQDNAVRALWPVGHRVLQLVLILVVRHVMPHVKEAA